MQRIIARLVESFEEGKISRRQLIESLAIAAGTAAGVTTAAAADSPLKTIGVNHFSYTVADYTKLRDFYSGLLGMEVTADDQKSRCNLRIGDTFMVARNGAANETKGVDHICYAIDKWNKDAVFAELKRRNLDPQPEGADGLQIKDPYGYHVQLVAKQNAPGERQFGAQPKK